MLAYMENKAADWVDWHSPYSDPQSSLSRRLRIIQEHIETWLVGQQNLQTRVISLCAGQGHDLLSVLEQLPGQRKLRALLIENDPLNVQVALNRAQTLGLTNVAIHCADAGNSNSFVGATPADLVLLCGVFGNISDRDILKTIEFLPRICASGATVIWTRSRRDPDVTPEIRRLFAMNGFREKSFTAPDGEIFSVGVNTFEGQPLPMIFGEQLFTFQQH
jgi:hypothetical protein